MLTTYPGLRLGNILYFVLHAHLRQEAGADYRVVDPSPADAWGLVFPHLHPLLIPPDQVRWTDRREDIPSSFLQGFGDDFSTDQLTEFIRARLLDRKGHEGSLGLDRGAKGDVVVNVRRGDYYSHPTFRALFGFDVVDYLERALDDLESRGAPARDLLVVSDDPQWCRENLRFLSAGQREVTWTAPTDGPLANFRSLVHGRRLILANSTFSYWGAYVSNVLYGDNHHEVWVPDLHSRAVGGGRPWQHDPRWRPVAVRG